MLVSEKNTRCNSMCLPSWRHFKCSTRVARPLYLVSHSKETKPNSRTMITGPSIVNWGGGGQPSILQLSLTHCRLAKKSSNFLLNDVYNCRQVLFVVCFCALLLERAVYVLVFLSLFLNVCHELWLLLPLDNAHLQHLSARLPSRLPHVP